MDDLLVLRHENINHVQWWLENAFGRESGENVVEKTRLRLAEEVLSINRQEANKRYDMPPEKQADPEIASIRRSDAFGETLFRIQGRLLTFKHFSFIPNDNHVKPRTPVRTRVIGDFKTQGNTVFVPETNKIPQIPYIRERKLYLHLGKMKRWTFRSLRTLSLPQFYYGDEVQENSANRMMDRFFQILAEEVDKIDVQAAD